MSALSVFPKISVVIPVFNASAHIEECLQHVFASEFKEFEVILVDDGSSDGTLAKIASFPARVLKNKTNQGAARSRDLGVREAKGRIIQLIDSDVLIPPGLFGRVWKYFEEHPDVSVLQGRYQDSPYFKNLLSRYKHSVFSYRGWAQGQTYVQYVHTACAAVRKDVFREFHFDERLIRREDIEFGHRLSQNGRLIFADSTLTVGHKKKYDFASFSIYQFKAAKELVLQHLVAGEKSLAKEIGSADQPLYKKLWLLRPALSLFALLAIAGWIMTGRGIFPALLTGILIASLVLEYRFRLYLLQKAPWIVSAAACGLYFYDGLLIGLGVLWGIVQAGIKKVPSGGKR